MTFEHQTQECVSLMYSFINWVLLDKLRTESSSSVVHRNETATSPDPYFIQRRILKPPGEEQKAFLFSPPVLGLGRDPLPLEEEWKWNLSAPGEGQGTPELRTLHCHSQRSLALWGQHRKFPLRTYFLSHEAGFGWHLGELGGCRNIEKFLPLRACPRQSNPKAWRALSHSHHEPHSEK